MMIYLAVTANLPAWLNFIPPILTACEWAAAALGVAGAIVSLALTGVHMLQHKHDWGALFLGVIGAIVGLGFAAGAVGVGQAIAGSLLAR